MRGATGPDSAGGYAFRAASGPAEIDQVHRLNHATFVDEVGQCRATGDGRLVDKFHGKNTYFVALKGEQVVGMVAVHDRPPFSIAGRLGDPDDLGRLGGRPLEVRLLAIRPETRHGMVVAGLLLSVHDHARRGGHTHLLISGLRHRVPLYEKLGFRALGPGLPSGAAEFVPMALDLGHPGASASRRLGRWEARRSGRPAAPGPRRVSLLPGPVEIAEPVREAFAGPPCSHRSPGFIARFERARVRLGAIVGVDGGRVALFPGSGTLAVDFVAAALAIDPGPGLVLANGEFGERLARQVARSGLEARVLRWPWGRPWDLGEVAEAARDRAIGWAWGVHLESSTGMLNDLPGLVEALRGSGARVCADCVSSLGAVPLDLSEIHLAAASVGKSLGAYAGLGVVFAGTGAAGRPSAGRPATSLDLAATLAARGPRFTVPSPLVEALDRALDDYATPRKRRARYDHYAELGRRVRRGLAELGIRPVAEGPWGSPVLTTFAPPSGWDAAGFRDECAGLGFEVAAESNYLRDRGWLQVATMGAVTLRDCDDLFRGLAGRLGRGEVAGTP